MSARLQTIVHETTLITEECCNCGVVFALPQYLKNNLKRTGDIFYCPCGHPQHYTDSIEEQLARTKKSLEQATQSWTFWREQAEEKGKELSSTRGQLTKLKNRVAKGVCPCCHRQFVQLEQHMKTKHPDYETAVE